MRKSIARKFFGVVILVCLPIANVLADAPVWKVSKGDDTVYLGGTIHILTAADYPLPAEFDKAYTNAATLVFETNMDALKTPEFQAQLMQSLMYSDGRSLKDDINAETFAALEKYCQSVGIPVEGLLNFKAGMVSVTLTMLELQKLGLMGTGVDEFYTEKAKQDKKAIDELETVAEQLSFLANMGVGEEDQLIIYTLRDIASLETMFEDLKTAWRTGDNESMRKLGLLPMKTEFPSIYNLILKDRNDNWLPRISEMFNSPEIEFVLVGALHLVGEDGLLNQLKKDGYVIEQLK